MKYVILMLMFLINPCCAEEKPVSDSCDMLIRLYELPHHTPLLEEQKQKGIRIRRALSPERHLILKWISETFSQGWASEVETVFNGHPISCWIATKDNQIIGFAVYDATKRGVAGPIGIDPNYRGKRLGQALLIATLHDMLHQGYDYTVIGWVGAENRGFFQKACNAEPIAESKPSEGMYKGLLKG